MKKIILIICLTAMSAAIAEQWYADSTLAAGSASQWCETESEEKQIMLEALIELASKHEQITTTWQRRLASQDHIAVLATVLSGELDDEFCNASGFSLAAPDNVARSAALMMSLLGWTIPSD